jgi:hypothetical protein
LHYSLVLIASIVSTQIIELSIKLAAKEGIAIDGNEQLDSDSATPKSLRFNLPLLRQ